MRNNRTGYIAILEDTKPENYDILRPAVEKLNFLSFDNLFKTECLEARNYTTVTTTDESNNPVYHVQRYGSSSVPRVFNHINDRCDCQFRVSHLLMCRHEIQLHKKFKLSYCDIQHHYRKQVTLSYNTGEQVQYNNMTDETILSRLLRTVEDSEKDGIKDTHIEDSDNEVDDSVNFTQEDQQQQYTHIPNVINEKGIQKSTMKFLITIKNQTTKKLKLPCLLF